MASTAGIPSPSPATPIIGEDNDHGNTNEKAAGPSLQGDADIPLSMAASLVLTDLPPNATVALEQAGRFSPEKVTVRFHPIGSAPALKQRVAKVSASKRFDTIVAFLRKRIGLARHESVFCYVNSTFAPAMDEGIGGLWKCFKVGEELVVNYSIAPAFG